MHFLIGKFRDGPDYGGGSISMENFIIKRGRITSVLVLVLFQGLSIKAIEPEDIFAPSLGRVVIMPHAAISSSYDDNVFLSSDEFISDEFKKIDDFITTFSPGIALRYGENILDANYIDFDYSPSFLQYTENSQLNSDNHLLSFAINYQKDGKFTFSGSDRISLDNTLLRGNERSLFTTSELGRKKSRGLLVEKFSAQDQYRFEYVLSPKTSIYLASSLDILDFDEEPHYYYSNVFGDLTPYSLFDVSNWKNTIGFGWQAFSKVKLYGSFFSGITSVETNLKRMGLRPDSDFYGGHISANGDFSDKLSGNILLGYQDRSFDSLSNGFQGGSHGLPIFEVSLNYKYTEKGDFSLQYRRSGNVSIQNPEWATNSDFIALNLNQKLGTTGKLRTFLISSFLIDAFQAEEKFKYQYLSLDGGVTYNFNEWMKTSFTYGFDFFEANTKGNIDYDVNRVMFSLSVGY